MITRNLEFAVENYGLLKIFFDANGLTESGVILETYNEPVYGGYATRLRYTYDENNNDAVAILTGLSLRHLGFNNMLHDYLKRCRFYTRG